MFPMQFLITVCRSHYRRVREIIANRKCTTCSTKYCDAAWKLVCDVTDSVDIVREQLAIPSESAGFFDWMCNRCRLFVSDSIMFTGTILSDQSSPDPVTAQKAFQINNALEKLRKEGLVFASHEIAQFKSFLRSVQTDATVIPRMATVFSNYLERVISKQSLSFHSYCPDAKKYGRVYYNDKIFNPLSIPYEFKQHLENQKLVSEVEQLQKSSRLRSDKVREMVKNQTTLFPSSGKFDYRLIITDDGSINEAVLNNYFDKELIEFVDSITTSEHSKTHPFHHTIKTAGR